VHLRNERRVRQRSIRIRKERYDKRQATITAIFFMIALKTCAPTLAPSPT
jgi:hypothetical protein